jgi:hypothetical protein
MHQAAGTRYLAKEARGDERRWKQWVGCFLGRIVEESVFLYCSQPAPVVVVSLDGEFPLPLLIPCVGDIWAKMSAGALGNA